MKRVLFTLFLSLITMNFVLAETDLTEKNEIQTRIDNIGTRILNANKIDKRVVFTYDESEKKGVLKNVESITKRQVIVYKNDYQYTANDDELAGYIAREIAAAARSFKGGTGFLSSVKIKAAPKKYELVFDKLAVDYMVTAGYNPIGLITFINKTVPQARQDRFSNKNLASKRLAYIYERIYTQYPTFLAKNVYITNDAYQNFLLTSQENRKLLQEKIQSGNLKQELKYE